MNQIEMLGLGLGTSGTSKSHLTSLINPGSYQSSCTTCVIVIMIMICCHDDVMHVSMCACKHVRTPCMRVCTFSECGVNSGT